MKVFTLFQLNPYFPNNKRQFLFTWCLAGVALEDLNSCDKVEFGDKSLYVYRMMIQYVASSSI